MAQRALDNKDSLDLSRTITIKDIKGFVESTGDLNPIHTQVLESYKDVVVPGLFLSSQFLLSLQPDDVYAFRFKLTDFAYPGELSIEQGLGLNKYIIKNVPDHSHETVEVAEVIPLEPKDAAVVSEDKEPEFRISPENFWEKIKRYCFNFGRTIPTAKAVYPFVMSLFPHYFVNHSNLGRELDEKKVSVVIKGIELRVYTPLAEIPRTAELTYYKPKWTMGVPRVLLEARLPDNKPTDAPFMSVSVSLPSRS